MKYILFLYFLLIFTSFSCEEPIVPVKNEAEVVWSYTIPNIKAFADVVKPVIENGLVYIAADSTLKCIELKNGVVKWQSYLGIAGDRIIQSQKILINGNLLFLNHHNWVKAFDKLTGNLVWQTTFENFRSIDMEIMSQNSTSLVVGGQGEVIKISKTSGNIEFRIQLNELIPSGYFQIAYNPVISEDGFIYVPTGWFDGTLSHGNILCYNSETGEYIWGYEIPNNNSGSESCGIKDSLLIFPYATSMFALNRFTGKKIWQTDIPEDGFWESVAVEGETVYMGSVNKARMYAFDLTSGNLKWKSKETESSIITIITVKNNRVYFCNLAAIYVLNALDGSVIWKGFPPEYYQDNTYQYKSPVEVGEGYMVCVGNKKVYCLTDP